MSWPIKKITDVCDLERGTEPGSAFYIEASAKAIPFLRVGDLSGKVDAPKFVKNDNNGKLQIVNKNETLITFDGTPGIVVRGLKGAIASGIRVVKNIKAEINGNFLFYYLRTPSVQKIIKAYSKGATIIHASSAIEHIKIPLPPLAIQKQIVERLDKISEAQKLNDDLIQKSDELFQSLLHKELNPAGKDWEIKNLEDIAKIIMGQSPSSTSYNESGHGLPFFQGKADFGELYPNTVKYCSAPSRIAEPEDILISVRAPVGDINLAKCKSCIGRGLAAIRGNTKIVEQMLLYFIFKKNEKNWQRQSTGSTFAAITKDKLTDYKIPLPPLEVQKQIVVKLSAVQEYKAQLLAQKSKLKELFDSVLAKSFSQ